MITFFLDSNAYIGDNVNAVIRINCSMIKIDYIDSNSSMSKEVVYNLSTNTRGGRTREGFAIKLDKNNRTCHLLDFLLITCTYYSMLRIIQLPCEKYYYKGKWGTQELWEAQ